MSEPRGVEERLAWMRDHEPGEAGLCANWTWKACGGNQDPPNPPAWGTPDANAVVDKCKAAGVLHTDREAPRGAIVLWTSDTHGHMALSKGPDYNYDIHSTDPYGNWGKTGTMPQKWCEQNWGQKWAGWTTHYAGVDLPMGTETGDTVSSNNYDYAYLDKPPGVFTVTRSYKDLDWSYWSPPRSGWESTHVYLNVKPRFKSGKTHGAIRVRVMRENDDATGHDTLSIDQDDLDGDGRLMLRYYYWEKGGAGDSTVVQLMCVGGLESAEISTRYTKRVTVVD